MIENVWVFLGLTCVFGGGCAIMTGQALAATWRPMGLAVPYALLLAAASRFLAFALFGGTLLSLPAFLTDSVVLAALALAAYRVTLAGKMVSQYPWLYRRDGLFDWEEVDDE
jgi:hypothetical protein